MKTKLVHRALRVDQIYWEAIIRYFSRSPDGTTGSEVIRRAIQMLGEWCMYREERSLPATEEAADEGLGLLFKELEKHL
jgi:hypothetical protein